LQKTRRRMVLLGGMPASRRFCSQHCSSDRAGSR
jgi:hypothetical protein